MEAKSCAWNSGVVIVLVQATGSGADQRLQTMATMEAVGSRSQLWRLSLLCALYRVCIGQVHSTACHKMHGGFLQHKASLQDVAEQCSQDSPEIQARYHSSCSAVKQAQ